MKTFQTEYEQVTDLPRLGDIYIFCNQRETVVHSCVHVAGNLVFTKNGSLSTSPWILMLMSDVVSLYQTEDPLIIRRIRLKSGGA